MQYDALDHGRSTSPLNPLQRSAQDRMSGREDETKKDKNKKWIKKDSSMNRDDARKRTLTFGKKNGNFRLGFAVFKVQGSKPHQHGKDSAS